MRKRILCIMLAMASVACSKTAEESSASLNVGEGQMTILLDASSQISATTRSADTYELPESVIPSESDFSLSITGTYIDESTLETKSYSYSYASIEEYNTAYEAAGGVKSPPYMPVGSYTATITDNRDMSEESSTNACFAGSVDFEIEARIVTATTTVTATLQNSVIRIQTTDDFNNYFEGGATLTITTESGATLNYTTPTDSDEEDILFVVPATTLYLEGSAVKQSPTESDSAAPTVTFAKQFIGTVTAGEMSTILVDADQTGGATFNVTLNDEITNFNEVNTELNE